MEVKVESREDVMGEEARNQFGAPWLFQFYRTMGIGVGVPARKTYLHHVGRGVVI